MGSRYFADTFYWIALIHPKDAWHGRVVAWATGHASAPLITTTEVLAEVLNWFAARGPAGRVLASSAVHTIRADASIQVLPPSVADFDGALTLYESRPDKSYSLTDCRSMVALRTLGVSEVLTNDRHFSQEGFTILFP
ncbi:MAG: type II toxin-antitoxin system VapC family toxin [Gemmataceae bacterium]